MNAQIQISFTLDIKTGIMIIGSDEFDMTVGADIVVEDIDIDKDLQPGGPLKDIGIDLRNITTTDIEDVEIRIDWYPYVVDVNDDRLEIGPIRVGGREEATFEMDIDADFAGYVQFELQIEADRKVVNLVYFTAYFGMRSQYISHWITDDDDGDDIAEPGEEIELRIARWNPTNEQASYPEVTMLDPSDDAIVYVDTSEDGGYDHIPAQGMRNSNGEYKLTIADAGDISGESDALTATTLELSGATWIPDAFVGGTLNPNTGQLEVYTITGNDETTIEVELNGKDPMDDVAIASFGDPFEIIVEGAPYNQFELEGHTVEFTLSVEEEWYFTWKSREHRRKFTGEEERSEDDDFTFTMRIGGIIRYLPPKGYDDLMDAISDDTGLGPNNNGNGIPEPGEIIEITVTLVNISDSDVEDVEARLESLDDDVDTDYDDDRMVYGEIRDGRSKSKKYLVEIEDNFEGNKITFELIIEDGDLGDLGKDEFTIPVGNVQ